MKIQMTKVLDRRLILAVTIVFSAFVSCPQYTRAAIIESRTSDGQTISQRSSDLETVRSLLEKEVVVQRLADYGYSKEDALMKINSASDEQLHQLASLSDNLAAGGDGLGVIVTILVIVLLVIIILKISKKEIIIR